MIFDNKLFIQIQSTSLIFLFGKILKKKNKTKQNKTKQNKKHVNIRKPDWKIE